MTIDRNVLQKFQLSLAIYYIIEYPIIWESFYSIFKNLLLSAWWLLIDVSN